jgi:hypothetical protein
LKKALSNRYQPTRITPQIANSRASSWELFVRRTRGPDSTAFIQVTSPEISIRGTDSVGALEHAFTPIRFKQTMVIAGGFCGLRRVLGWTGALGLPKN